MSTNTAESVSLEARIARLEGAIRQLYQLESRFKPGSFREKEPMTELREILEDGSRSS